MAEEKKPSNRPKITGLDAGEIHDSDIDINQSIGEIVGRDKNTTNIYMGDPDSQEQKIAQDRYEEKLLQNYLDKMAELLLPPNNLRDSPKDSAVRNIARARTLTVLQGLNAERKGSVVQFLYESELIKARKAIIVLHGANLGRALLKGAYLKGANLKGTNLPGADLTEAYLQGTNLIGADLTEANLEEAQLEKADLREARLKGTNLKLARLEWAHLSKSLRPGGRGIKTLTHF